MCVKLLQPYLTLCNPVDCSSPGSSVHGTLQERVLEWVTIFFSRGSSWPRDWTQVSFVSCTGRQALYHQRQLRGDVVVSHSVVSELNYSRLRCSALSNSCNPIDWSLPGSSVHGILQARRLKWVAISFSGGSSRPRDPTLVSCIAGRFKVNIACVSQIPYQLS